jgi:hypothetical protein
MNNSTGKARTTRWFGRTLILATSIMTMLLLTACGSTKVYNNDKTIVYQDSVYNVSKVKQISSKTTGKLSDDSIVNLKGANKKKVQGLIKENGSIYVRMSFDLDEQEMLYRAKSVENWGDFNRMQNDFDKARKQITSLLGDKKKMQLKLR